MKKFKIKIVVANYYKEITDPLTQSCIEILEQSKIKYEILTVPGVYEIPQMIKWKIKPNNYNLFIALGCVIKGETYHFEVIANETSRKIMDLSIEFLVPIGFGILTCYDLEQAIIRSDINQKNKGQEAALACIELLK